VALAGCTPPADTRTKSAAVLYVANSRDGTVSRIDLPGGRSDGETLPAGPAPAQLVASRDGRLLVAPTATEHGGELTLVTLAAGVWGARPVSLEPGARQVLLAGDGGDHALVAYQLPGTTGNPAEARCRLVLVDLGAGDVAPPRTVCRGPESVVGLALDDPPGGDPIAYLAVWRSPARGDPDGCEPPPGGRIVAVRARTGAPVAAAPLAGVPDRLALGPGGPDGRRLYAVEAAPIPSTGLPDECPYMTHGKYVANAGQWTVVGLTPDTLAVERRHPLRQQPYALAVAPDGDHAYALAPMTVVIQLDLVSRTARPFATLADVPLGIAVAADRVYVSDPRANAVRALDRQSGREVRVIPTGRGPIALTLAGGSGR
jgi:DNA-binding beta-propeller fold protein YncE